MERGQRPADVHFSNLNLFNKTITRLMSDLPPCKATRLQWVHFHLFDVYGVSIQKIEWISFQELKLPRSLVASMPLLWKAEVTGMAYWGQESNTSMMHSQPSNVMILGARGLLRCKIKTHPNDLPWFVQETGPTLRLEWSHSGSPWAKQQEQQQQRRGATWRGSTAATSSSILATHVPHGVAGGDGGGAQELYVCSSKHRAKDTAGEGRGANPCKGWIRDGQQGQRQQSLEQQ